MKDSLNQEANLGDLIVHSSYSGGHQHFGIISKVTPTSISFFPLRGHYTIDDWKGDIYSDEDMFTHETSRKSSSGLFTIVTPLLNVILKQPVIISSYKNKSHPTRNTNLAEVYKSICKYLRI